MRKSDSMVGHEASDVIGHGEKHSNHSSVRKEDGKEETSPIPSPRPRSSRMEIAGKKKKEKEEGTTQEGGRKKKVRKENGKKTSAFRSTREGGL